MSQPQKEVRRGVGMGGIGKEQIFVSLAIFTTAVRGEPVDYEDGGG
jgi:hypothetical protein